MNSQTAKDEERRGRPLSPRPDPARIEALRARMTARGQTVTALAREIGEDASNVYKVLSGTRAASSGVGNRIAVKLGLKDVPAPAVRLGHFPANLEPTR
jgi:gp16 family phage-associated protein